jgi:hypothetical protein
VAGSGSVSEAMCCRNLILAPCHPNVSLAATMSLPRCLRTGLGVGAGRVPPSARWKGVGWAVSPRGVDAGRIHEVRLPR